MVTDRLKRHTDSQVFNGICISSVVSVLSMSLYRSNVPLDALELEGILAIPTEDKCTHCDLCIPVCPVHALEIKEEPILA